MTAIIAHEDGTIDGLEEARAFVLASPITRSICRSLVETASKRKSDLGSAPTSNPTEARDVLQPVRAQISAKRERVCVSPRRASTRASVLEVL